VSERAHAVSSASGHYGAAGTGVTFAEATIVSAWNVQGGAERRPFLAEAQMRFGVSLPVDSNTTAKTDTLTVLWLGPGSWLLLSRNGARLGDFGACRDALNKVSGALFDVSDSRVAWTISGTHAPTVLAKGCPLDFHTQVFRPGMCAQSLLGHIGALFVKDAEAFTVMVARSFARDVWHALTGAAAQYGYEVLPSAPYR
jgi:sarcosine oxidase subunit gamma